MRGHKHHIALVECLHRRVTRRASQVTEFSGQDILWGRGVLCQQLKMKGCPGKFTVGKGSHRAKDLRLRGSQEPRVARIK